MTVATPKIRIENLIKIYGEKPHHALKMFREGGTRDSILEKTGHVLGIADVSFSVNEGELFVIMGLSGSGKSTLVRCINRLIEPTSGNVYIDGEDVAHVQKERMRDIRRTKMAMVFQTFGLFPHKTVLDNVAYGLKIQGMSQEEREKKAQETLEVVGLGAWGNYLPSSLSGGMQQRVGLARALATDAEILLMDEAFGALDPLIRRGMQEELIQLQENLHKTIIFISHDIQEALKIGDRVAIMKDGYIVQIGTPEDLITKPANDYIEAFTQEVNRAQVLKTGTIARQTVPVILGEDSVKAALAQMQRDDLKQMYVVNRKGYPVGLVQKKDLETSSGEGTEDISNVMQCDFPKARGATSLEEIFHLCEKGLPIAVIDKAGKFKGMVEQSDVLASIGRLSHQREKTEEKQDNIPVSA